MKMKRDQTFFKNIYRSMFEFKFESGHTPPSQSYEGKHLDAGQSTNIRDIEENLSILQLPTSYLSIKSTKSTNYDKKLLDSILMNIRELILNSETFNEPNFVKWNIDEKIFQIRIHPLVQDQPLEGDEYYDLEILDSHTFPLHSSRHHYIYIKHSGIAYKNEGEIYAAFEKKFKEKFKNYYK